MTRASRPTATRPTPTRPLALSAAQQHVASPSSSGAECFPPWPRGAAARAQLSPTQLDHNRSQPALAPSRVPHSVSSLRRKQKSRRNGGRSAGAALVGCSPVARRSPRDAQLSPEAQGRVAGLSRVQFEALATAASARALNVSGRRRQPFERRTARVHTPRMPHIRAEQTASLPAPPDRGNSVVCRGRP